MLRAADAADAEECLRAALAHEARTQPEEDSDSDSESGEAAAPEATVMAADCNEGDEEGEENEGERAERVAAFGRVMRERFLAGGEAAAHVDYEAVDSDATLDDHWVRVADADAEDAYFGQAP